MLWLKATVALFSDRTQAEYPRKNPQKALLLRIQGWEALRFLSKKKLKPFVEKKFDTIPVKFSTKLTKRPKKVACRKVSLRLP